MSNEVALGMMLAIQVLKLIGNAKVERGAANEVLIRVHKDQRRINDEEWDALLHQIDNA